MIAEPEGVVVDRIDVGEVTLTVAQAGPSDGPPVLLLHGFPDSHLLWRHQIAALAAAGHRVVAPDLRGFGESDRPMDVQAYRMRRLVGDVAGLLGALRIERAAVVGHDWGAGLAWATAMALPDRVERLAVVSVGHPAASAGAGIAQRQASWYMLWFLFEGVAEKALPADDWTFFRRWGWAGAGPGEDADCDRQVSDLSRPGALTAALGWYRANIDPAHFVGRPAGASTSLPRVGCPVLGVWSSDDSFLTEAQMTGSAEFVDGPWRYERIDGVDHWVPVHAAERLSDLLVDFFA